MSTILVTGGAGYIGSHAVKKLLKDGQHVIVFDNFSRGYREPLEIVQQYGKLETIAGDLLDPKALEKVFKKHTIDAVMHFAALCLVDESMREPEQYFENNVVGTFRLLEAMRKHDVKRLIFSSTCAVYGEPESLPVDEKHARTPVNPYGESKKMAEDLIMWYGKLHDIHYTLLRYFNVCGADADGEIGDSKKPSQLLVQNAVRGALGIEDFSLTCPKVDTKDGTPIRDYVDVEDLIDAHMRALTYIDDHRSLVCNLGSGQGWSVQEIIQAVENELTANLVVTPSKTREGEYAAIYANTEKAQKELDWKPKTSMKESILKLKAWYTKKPNGYDR